MQEFLRQLRKPALSEVVLFGIMLFCSLVDMPGNFHHLGNGPSDLGAGTIAVAGLVWAVFLVRPVFPTFVLKTLLFLALFELYCSGTMLWSNTGSDGVQLLVVGVAFFGLIVICARETAMNLNAGHFIARAMLIASSIGVGIYLYVCHTNKKLGESRDDDFIHPRPFALFAITIVAVALSRWRAPHRSKLAALVPLAWAAITTFTVALSMSRTALVCCVALFPLAIVLRLNLKSLIQGLLVLGAGGFLFVSAVLAYKPLYDRFVGYDASMHVAGMTVNASGRTAIWDTLLRSIGDDWVFGKGEAASEIIIRRKFNGLIAQPHNDYLRFYYDTGVVGLGLWLCFTGAFYAKTLANLRRSVRDQTPDYPLHVAAILAFSAVSWSMLTDNSICYSFVMMPLGMVMGCSLGAGMSHYPSTATEGFEVIFPEQFAQPIRRNIRSV